MVGYKINLLVRCISVGTNGYLISGFQCIFHQIQLDCLIFSSMKTHLTLYGLQLVAKQNCIAKMFCLRTVSAISTGKMYLCQEGAE